MDTNERLLALAKHVLAMADDAYLVGHPEWIEIVREARALIDNIAEWPCDTFLRRQLARRRDFE
jgi:hypothetical protein